MTNNFNGVNLLNFLKDFVAVRVIKIKLINRIKWKIKGEQIPCE